MQVTDGVLDSGVSPLPSRFSPLSPFPRCSVSSPPHLSTKLSTSNRVRSPARQKRRSFSDELRAISSSADTEKEAVEGSMMQFHFERLPQRCLLPRSVSVSSMASPTKCQQCSKDATLKCPSCLKLGLPVASFCSQECFKLAWPTHKLLHSIPLTPGMPALLSMSKIGPSLVFLPDPSVETALKVSKAESTAPIAPPSHFGLPPSSDVESLRLCC